MLDNSYVYTGRGTSDEGQVKKLGHSVGKSLASETSLSTQVKI